jgi:hypothetical protein
VKINPLKWRQLFTNAEIEMETEGIKTIYVKSLAATIDQNFGITDLQQINRFNTENILCNNIF